MNTTVETTMTLDKTVLIIHVLLLNFVLANDNVNSEDVASDFSQNVEEKETAKDVFNGVYTECFLHLSYSCLQKKTLLYLRELNKLSEVSVIGEYVKFGKEISFLNLDFFGPGL